MNEDLVCKKEEIDCSNIIKQYKMFNFDYIAKEDSNPIVTELFIRETKLNFSLVFIIDYFFPVPKTFD